MTNSDLTLLAVLVDRSGSMASRHSDMEDGLNRYLESQGQRPGQLDVMLAQFDTEYDVVMPPTRFTGMQLRYTLVPRWNNSAVLDSMGRFITETGKSLDGKPENERPDKVIICTVTDGQDNSSVDWSKDDVKRLIDQQHDQWHWEFVFLGANLDAVNEAAARDDVAPAGTNGTRYPLRASANGTPHQARTATGETPYPGTAFEEAPHPVVAAAREAPRAARTVAKGALRVVKTVVGVAGGLVGVIKDRGR